MDERHTDRHRRLNRIFRIIAGAYVIVFLPLLLSYLGLQYFTAFSGRMLIYALIPLMVVVLVLFLIYVVRIVRNGHFWSHTEGHEDLQTLHHTDK